MSARIAPEPVSAGSSVVGDYRSRTATGESRASGTTTSSGTSQQSLPLKKTSSAAGILPPLPTPGPSRLGLCGCIADRPALAPADIGA